MYVLPLSKTILIKVLFICLAGRSGTVLFDGNADRRSTYWLWGLEADGAEFTMLADILVKGESELVSYALGSVLA